MDMDKRNLNILNTLGLPITELEKRRATNVAGRVGLKCRTLKTGNPAKDWGGRPGNQRRPVLAEETFSGPAMKEALWRPTLREVMGQLWLW